MIDLNDIATRIQRANVLVYDAETTGLDWRKDQTVGHVLTFSANPADSFYLPIRHGISSGRTQANLDPDKVNLMLHTEFRNRDQLLRYVGFNWAFDLKFLHNDGIVPRGPLEDGMINASLINNLQPYFSLDYCCTTAGVQAKKGDALYQHLWDQFGNGKGKPGPDLMEHFHKLSGDDPLAVDYAIGDGTSTWQLWEKQQTKLDEVDVKGHTLRPIWAIECRVIRVLHRMTLRGIKVDEERLDQVRRMIEAKLSVAQAQFPSNFNDKAPTHLKRLFADAGVPDDQIPHTDPSKKFPRTDANPRGGQASYNAAWLETHPLGKKVVAVRKYRFMLDSFLTPLQERHLWKGRVHADYNQTRGEDYGTITGRLSCSNPNMQQIHKRDKALGSVFRSIFVPDPGMIWAAVDYGQIEPRLLAHFGEVKTLLDGYRQIPPMDAHSAVAKAAGIDREPGKRMNQALLTGAGMGRMKELLMEYGADAHEASRIMNNYFASMPEIKPFQKKVANVFRARGYIETLLGRKVYLDNPEFAYTGLNRILQGGNADINKKALADVDELYASEGDQCHLLNDVHDDLCQQFHPDNRKTFERALELMQDYGPDGQSVYLTIPMVVDVGEGYSWAEATYGLDTVKAKFKEMGGTY